MSKKEPATPRPAATVLLCVPAAALAQDKPDFSGVYVFNEKRSDDLRTKKSQIQSEKPVERPPCFCGSHFGLAPQCPRARR